MIAADLQNVQVWIATTPVDMRKSFDGLAEVVKSFLGHDPLSGSLFVFRNKGGHLVKVLWWDRDGLTIYYKRLERGEFQFPRSNKPSLEISCEQLRQLLSGMRSRSNTTWTINLVLPAVTSGVGSVLRSANSSNTSQRADAQAGGDRQKELALRGQRCSSRKPRPALVLDRQLRTAPS